MYSTCAHHIARGSLDLTESVFGIATDSSNYLFDGTHAGAPVQSLGPYRNLFTLHNASIRRSDYAVI